MIRPFTCLCVLMAAGSGLYLYQTKHRTLMLDQQIASVLKQADAARARTALLETQHASLSQTQRLRDLSTRFLSLRPTAPNQYVQLASLDEHLPPVESFPKPAEIFQPPAPPAPVATPDATTDTNEDAADATTPPPPPPVVASAPPAEVHPAPVRLAAAATPHPPRRPAPSATQYADTQRPAPTPLAPEHPAATPVALHRAPAPARPLVTTADADRAYVPRSYAAAASPNGRVTSVAASGGSMLGQSSTLSLAAPVPVSN